LVLPWEQSVPKLGTLSAHALALHWVTRSGQPTEPPRAKKWEMQKAERWVFLWEMRRAMQSGQPTEPPWVTT
jgi:hypothetical protein